MHFGVELVVIFLLRVCFDVLVVGILCCGGCKSSSMVRSTVLCLLLTVIRTLSKSSADTALGAAFCLFDSVTRS